MATIEEVTQSVNDLTVALNASNTTLDLIDTKLDEIRDFIAGLTPAASQEQLDALAALVNSAKDAAVAGQAKAEAALAETDALDE